MMPCYEGPTARPDTTVISRYPHIIGNHNVFQEGGVRLCDVREIVRREVSCDRKQKLDPGLYVALERQCFSFSF